MAVKVDTILKDLKAEKFAPIYFFHGEEPYYIDLLTNYIEQNALNESEKSFNLTVLYGKDVQLLEVLNAAKRYPMMARRQVIIVKEAQQIPDWSKKEAVEQLEKFFEKVIPTTVLVFCYKNKKVDGKTKLYKLLDTHTILVESAKVYDNKLPDWVTQFCKEKNFGLHPKAAVLLAESIGNDLHRMSNELDKLLINFEPGYQVSQDDVSKYIGISKEFNVFELQNALVTNDFFKATQIVNFFASNPKDHPIIPVIASLFGFFQKILLLHANQAKTKDQVVNVLKVHPFFAQDYLQALKSFGLARTKLVLGELYLADLRSKGIAPIASEKDILIELIYAIAHTDFAQARAKQKRASL